MRLFFRKKFQKHVFDKKGWEGLRMGKNALRCRKVPEKCAMEWEKYANIVSIFIPININHHPVHPRHPNPL